ncbi:unnamed protein product (macronuclear) [Paramecium tetraurelia]|uniref:Uncharacterized protein n=1 Tax=Paramecium tetraurelia TaxID=5888 RepID=A0BJV1_PARTE|nr:uncharacterized protein GSPATT00029447001 [Paramecium tetraurelia]CAK58818.1 unnamed protein product [Paramecium tetraurelia]|eukprot:XP_001426216.1 hypothetical protein (macronuclear) [Paramecium tetraurelia strain d4-2]
MSYIDHTQLFQEMYNFLSILLKQDKQLVFLIDILCKVKQYEISFLQITLWVEIENQINSSSKFELFYLVDQKTYITQPKLQLIFYCPLLSQEYAIFKGNIYGSNINETNKGIQYNHLIYLKSHQINNSKPQFLRIISFIINEISAVYSSNSYFLLFVWLEYKF